MKQIYKNLIGIRPWESVDQEKEGIDLSQDSNKIIAEEGDQR